MKGLLLKDIINLKQQGKIYVLIIAIWLALGIANKDGDFFGGVMMMLTILVPLTAVAYDDKAKWDRYALTMPVSRMDLVLSKYVLMAACAVAGSIISEVVSVIITKNVRSSLISSVVFMSIGIIFASVILPLIFKFGVEKGRMLMLIVLLVPTILVMLLPQTGIRIPMDEFIKKAVYFAPLAAVFIAAVSIFISKKIYDHKEF